MRRVVLASIIVLSGVGLTACASTGDPAVTDTVTVTETAKEPVTAPSSNAGAEPSAAGGPEQCDRPDGQVCVIRGATVATDVKLGAFRVVKLIDSTIEGDVDLSGARQVVVTGSRIDGGLDVTAETKVVLTDSRIGGDVRLRDARDATVVANSIGGDLECLVSRANGRRNSVGGTASGACRSLR